MKETFKFRGFEFDNEREWEKFAREWCNDHCPTWEYRYPDSLYEWASRAEGVTFIPARVD